MNVTRIEKVPLGNGWRKRGGRNERLPRLLSEQRENSREATVENNGKTTVWEKERVPTRDEEFAEYLAYPSKFEKRQQA